MGIRQAAWVPEDVEQDYDDAAALAARWIRGRALEERASAVLVTNVRDAASGVPALRGFEVTSPQSRSRPASGGPVLAYVPSLESLVYAGELARGSSLVVVEGFNFSVRGWAREYGALNLFTEQEEPGVQDKRWSDALERLAFHRNNGYGDTLGKRTARRVVHDLRTAGLLRSDELVSAMAAKGASVRALKNLQRIVDGA
ncbi:hypothetical protein ACFUJU_30585 [Streptomyces sp. NPDC057235]|uniref:hypothetical protein n=1 Tax=Streptomyces sp. NPDC057235 TaxID=3346058 RepID=UPI003625F38A